MVDIPFERRFLQGKVAAGASKFKPGISAGEYRPSNQSLAARASVRNVLGSENRVY